jgi:hypothetical protein
MKFDLNDEAVREMFGSYSFRRLADPEKADVFLKEYADKMKEEHAGEICEETLYAIERKHWVESGFRQEGFSILKEVVLGRWNTDFLSPFKIEECYIKKKLHLEYLHFFAEKNGMLVEAELEFLDRPTYTVVWAKIQVPWSFTGGRSEFNVNGEFDDAVKRIGRFFDVAGAYRGTVADMIMDLAEKHRVVVNCLWHVTDVCAYPRKNFASALRRIQRFLMNYDPEEIRKKALQLLDSRDKHTRH